MSNLTASHPTIALQIADHNLTPLLTSAPNNSDATIPQAQALLALTSTSNATFETARRLGLGLPQRVMIETSNSGPVLLQSYLNPSSVTPRHLMNGVESSNGYLSDLLDVGRPNTGVSEQPSSTETATAGGPSNHLTNGFDTNHGAGVEDHANDEPPTIQPPPMLFATVIVPRPSDLNEGRTVAMQMERVGRHFQREWLRDQLVEGEQAPRDRSADGSNDG